MDHDFVHLNAYGVFVCRYCALDAHAAELVTECPLIPAYLCPTAHNAYTRGTCAEWFTTPSDASDHWSREHRAEPIPAVLPPARLTAAELPSWHRGYQTGVRDLEPDLAPASSEHTYYWTGYHAGRSERSATPRHQRACRGCGQPLRRDWTPTDPTLAEHHAGCRPGAGRLPILRGSLLD